MTIIRTFLQDIVNDFLLDLIEKFIEYQYAHNIQNRKIII